MGIGERTRPQPPRPATAPARPGSAAPGSTGTALRPPAPASASVGRAAFEAGKSVLRDSLLEKRPYLKFAFANPYNLTLLGGMLAAAGLTLNPVLALAAIGAEALWLLWAPDSERLRHILWDPRFEALREAIEANERAERMRGLGETDRSRVESLVAQQRRIRDLAARNPSFTGDLLKAEIAKTGRLVDSFLEMAINCARYEDYLSSVDQDQLASDRERWEREVRSGKEGDPQTELAKKNFAILLKRIEKMKEIRRYLDLARGQLDLIENSFQLIADQIVTIDSPGQLSGQLDELLDGVEAIKETAADTEKLLGSLGF
jgi:hypothetical protein